MGRVQWRALHGAHRIEAQLAGYLDKLLTDPGASVQGATGELRLDAMGTVQRAPAWAVFSGGRPRAAMDGALLPESPSY